MNAATWFLATTRERWLPLPCLFRHASWILRSHVRTLWAVSHTHCRYPDKHCSPFQPSRTLHGRIYAGSAWWFEPWCCQGQGWYHVLRTLAFRPVPFHVPKRFRDTLLIAELRHNPVNRYPSYDADNIVFLLVAVHVEQHFECTSCHTRFLSLKLSINELCLVNQPKPYGEKFSTEYQKPPFTG